MTFIHALADVQSKSIGEGSQIWQYSVILNGALIGKNCHIYPHTFIDSGVSLGDNVTINSGACLWNGVELGSDVFVGPNVTFTNTRFPERSCQLENTSKTICHNGSSIGAGSTILPDLIIGERAIVGAGAVVTRSIPSNAIVQGNPARIVGYVGTSKPLENLSQGETPAEWKIGVTQTSVNNVTLHRFPYITDFRGNLTVGEFERSVPFVPKRYFMIFGVPDIETRGEHAHIRCEQFLVCVAGSCAVVADDGINREEFILNRQDLGLYLPSMTWGVQYKYSKDAVLLVFASDYYDKNDYIREYRKFLDLRKYKNGNSIIQKHFA